MRAISQRTAMARAALASASPLVRGFVQVCAYQRRAQGTDSERIPGARGTVSSFPLASWHGPAGARPAMRAASMTHG